MFFIRYMQEKWKPGPRTPNIKNLTEDTKYINIFNDSKNLFKKMHLQWKFTKIFLARLVIFI